MPAGREPRLRGVWSSGDKPVYSKRSFKIDDSDGHVVRDESGAGVITDDSKLTAFPFSVEVVEAGVAFEVFLYDCEVIVDDRVIEDRVDYVILLDISGEGDDFDFEFV